MKMNLVTVVASLSIVATIVWIIGLGMTINDQLLQESSAGSPPASTSDEAEQSSDTFLLALGDSLTRGTGDLQGQGYVTYLLDELKSRSDQSIQLSNLAVRGYTSEELLNQLEQTEIQRQIAQADMIFMTIGGNDLFQGGQALSVDSAFIIENSTETYLENLEEIYSAIESANGDTTVYHLGLYNPFNQLDGAEMTSSAVRNWNNESAEIAAKFDHVVFVPTYDLFQLDVNDFIYSDQFHPNNEGYQLIGRRLAALITLNEGGEGDE
ncbi:GDSL family lipase [Salipaludibacillus keqinensis]|uniref:GDSL family lipase n=1 Tax=Salipaludibacillus keqinensis TaxID=2045207 RepID=A0A323TJD9_9BACI|nr:GDSL-type esterase/lipase family protein [Salipaludibacillus keqinensis]PYZ94968.1 GDSL family lipase [Salipaludibacillus keqinensis]